MNQQILQNIEVKNSIAYTQKVCIWWHTQHSKVIVILSLLYNRWHLENYFYMENRDSLTPIFITYKGGHEVG